MKRKYLILFLLAAICSFTKAQTIKTVGSGGDYANIRLAFEAVNNRVLTGDIELQVISSITDNNTAKLYAAGQVSEVVVAYNTGSGYTQNELCLKTNIFLSNWLV